MKSKKRKKMTLKNEEDFRKYSLEVERAGYTFITGLYDRSNIYNIVAIVRKPEEWEPYRAPDYFDDIDAVALWWWYNEDLSEYNDNGEMIYEEPDPDDYDDPDDVPEVNTNKYEITPIGWLIDGFLGLSLAAQLDVISRLKDAAAGTIGERWDAYRSDKGD